MANWGNGSILEHKTKNKSGFKLKWRDQKGKQHVKIVYISKAEARLELRKILSQVDKGEFVTNKRDSFSDFAITFLKMNRGKWAASTYQANVSTLTENGGGIVQYLGDKPMQKITSKMIIDILDHWIIQDKVPTARLRYSYLNYFFNEAVKLEIINKNPMLNIPKPRPNKPDKKALTPKEWLNFYSVIDDDMCKTFFRLMTIGGFRRSEMCGFTLGDINHSDKSISSKRGYSVVKGQGVYGDTKNHAQANMPLDEDTFNLLEDHVSKISLLALRFDKPLTKDDPLFPNLSVSKVPDRWKPINPDTWSKWFKKYAQKSGLDNTWTIHELRHTMVSLMVQDMNLDPLVVSKRVRHADVGFTLNQYAHLFSGAQKEASEEIGKLLK